MVSCGCLLASHASKSPSTIRRSFLCDCGESSAGPSMYFFFDFLTMPSNSAAYAFTAFFYLNLPPNSVPAAQGKAARRDEGRKIHLPKKSFCRVAQINLLAHNHTDLGTIFGVVDSRGHNKLRPELGSPTLRCAALRMSPFVEIEDQTGGT